MEGFRKKVILNLKGLREALIFDLHVMRGRDLFLIPSHARSLLSASVSFYLPLPP